MRDVGDEIAPGFFHPLDLRLVVQHGDSASARHGSGGQIEDAPGENLGGARRGHVAGVQSVLYGAQNLRVARRLHQRFSQAYPAGQQAFHALIRPQDAPIRGHGDDRLLHGVQQRLQGLAAVLQGTESVFQLAGGLIEGRRHVRDFVGRIFLDSGGQIALPQRARRTR